MNPPTEARSLRCRSSRGRRSRTASSASRLRERRRTPQGGPRGGRLAGRTHGKSSAIHRDIKPGNIWLEGDLTSKDLAQQIRRCKILDFGLARWAHKDDAQLTATGAILGTPAFMAAEQARGERVDHRSDLFSLGVTLYRMATGKMPFNGPDTMAVLIALTTETPTPACTLAPKLPPALTNLIDRLMSKDPAGRPQSAAEVSASVRQIVAKSCRVRLDVQPGASVPPVALPAPPPPPMWEEVTEGRTRRPAEGTPRRQ